MDVSVIEMSKEEAREKLEQYREVLAGRHSQNIETEFEAAANAYAELAKGTPLINLPDAIRNCGWRADGRPVLAVARADQMQVEWEVLRDSRVWNNNTRTGRYAPLDWIFRARKKRWDSQRSRNLRYEVRGIQTEPPIEPRRGVAMVPLVPPAVYPARGLDLAKHFILWEVESWDFAPPVDPMLLRPIGGDLYAVIGQWDLTELERSIISGTRRQ